MKQEEINALVAGYLDESLSGEQQQQLADWIKTSPANAEEFARASMLHDRLQHELSQPTEIAKVLSETTVAPALDRPPPKRPMYYPWIYAAAAVIITLLAFSYWGEGPKIHDRGISGNSPSFATLAHAVNARYVDSQAFSIGHRLGTGLIRLETGFIRLQFDTGVEVTLQGPAEYDLVHSERTHLSKGSLTASVPEGAEGFRIDTPTAEVTDLGTAFGLALDESGASMVSVFDGEVSIAQPGSDSRMSLKEGEALRIAANDAPTSVAFDTTPFERHWPISSGIEHSSGAFRLIPHWRRLRFARSDDQVFVRREGFVVTLTNPLKVNISQPGRYEDESQLTPETLPVGTIVKSLILHYQPREPRVRQNVRRLVGTITFARPVLGLIVLHEELKASARRFSHMSAGESHRRRELDLNGRPIGDVIEVSDDRRTLQLDLASPMFSSDLIRVIVDAELPTPEIVLNQ